MVGIKVRGVSKSAGAELSSTHVFPALMCLQHLCVSSTLWLNSGYHIIKSYFWHRANFELKYLRPQMGYRKVMVCPRKLCSSRFRNTPYFYSYLNSKGFYGLQNVMSTFFVDTLYVSEILYTISQKEICAVNDSLCSMRFIICCSVIGSYYETHTTERIVYCADLLLTLVKENWRFLTNPCVP